MMKTSFMTFVCPEWTAEQAVAFAKKAGYDGVELRVDAGHRHEVSSKSSTGERKRIRSLFRDAGVAIACMAMSERFNVPDDAKRRGMIGAAKLNLDLAADLGAPVVRCFAGGDGGPMSEEAADRLAESFTELAEHGAPLGVCPMLECGHDIVVSGKEAAQVLKRVSAANFGALWNYSELDAETLETLRPRLRHFHVHDEVLEPGNENILTLARQAKSIGFDGFVSIEVIKGVNLPEDQLIETGRRLKSQIRRAYEED